MPADVLQSQLAGQLDRKALEQLGVRLWSGALGLVLLVTHVAGMRLAGFTAGGGTVAYVATALGLVAVPLCAWQLAGRLDPLADRFGSSSLGSIALRLLSGVALVAVAPAAYRVLHGVPLQSLSETLELGIAVLSVAVMAGLVLLSLGVADLLYIMTAQVQHLSTRLMVLLLVAALAHFFWLSLVGLEARNLVLWAVEQGHLGAYLEAMDRLSRSASVYLGGLAGAVGFELPFLLIMAWRFGRKATTDLTILHDGFERVARGELDEPIPVSGNDEVADMLRGFNGMLSAVRERRFLENAFGKYVSPVVLEELRHKGESSLFTGERREATVLFSDICGFTAMSAALPPERVIGVLNEYMSRMIETVARHDGYIDKFVGDAIMVIWNAPIDQPDHAARAVACARAMQEELARANAEGIFGDVGPLEMGIGLNTGPLVAGNLGNERQVEFTVVGDTVNVASRACAHASAGNVLLTTSVVEGARRAKGETDPAIEVTSLGPVEVKGKGALEFFALQGLPNSAEGCLEKRGRDSFAPPQSAPSNA